MPIDFKHALGQHTLFSPTKTNVVFLTIKSLHKHRKDDCEEFEWHEDEAKSQLRGMKPHQIRRLFQTKEYNEFCAALQQCIDEGSLIYNRDNDSIRLK